MGRTALRTLVIALVAVLGLSFPTPSSWGNVASSDPGDAPVELLLFWGDGCPHCEAEKVWLDNLQDEFNGLEIREYEVWYDAENRRLFEQVAADHGVEPQGVPGTFVGDAGWIGFNDAIAFEIEEAVRTASQGDTPEASEQSVVTVPFVGEVDLGDSSLVVSTLVIGFVDGVNPCSLWVLTMLLALVLHSGSRRRGSTADPHWESARMLSRDCSVGCVVWRHMTGRCPGCCRLPQGWRSASPSWRPRARSACR